MSETNNTKRIRSQFQALRKELKEIPREDFEQKKAEVLLKIRELEKAEGITYCNVNKYSSVGYYVPETFFSRLKRFFKISK